MGQQMSTVAVVGLGTMGAGIAEVLAGGGRNVIGIEVGDTALDAGRGHLDASLSKAVRRGKRTEADADTLRASITFTTDLAAAGGADAVIEAVPERMELKRAVFAELDRVCRSDAVLATNTSSLSVTEIAAGTTDPSRVVGVHFFNPAPVMDLVELVSTVISDGTVLDDMADLVTDLGKTPVRIGDRAGFVANALLLPYLNHAVQLYEARYATADDIDAAVTLGIGLPMGPLALLDLIGLDTALAILDVLYDEFREQRYAPAPLLRRMVAAGLLGRKTGRGFYDHTGAPVTPTPATEPIEPEHIGVLGEEADSVAELCTAAGYRVTLAEFGEEERVLGDCDLIVVATPAPRAVIDLAMRTGRSADAVGLRLISERLAEIVTTVNTSQAAVSRAMAVCHQIDRHAVRCPDRAGFLVDTLILPHVNDAIRMLDGGYASADDIDTAMKLGCGYPRGPLLIAERLGLERVQAGLRRLHQQYRNAAFAPSPLLEQLVTAGHTGRKPGRGLRDVVR